MVGCTTVAGVFMFGVHAFMPVFGAASYGLFVALIYLINVSTIPSPGLQTIFAHEAASVRREEDGHLLAGNVVGVLLVMTAGWGLGLLAVCLGQEWVLARLKIENVWALWVTLVAILPYLWLPIFLGVLQGRQAFGYLGASVLANGAGRFLTIAAILFFMGNSVSLAMMGPLLGGLVASGIGAWCCRDLFTRWAPSLSWRWIWQALPIMVGPGILQFMLAADALVARARFDEVTSGYYGAAGMVGRGLVMFVGPVAGVMFPKLVSESSGHKGARLVKDTALATGIIVLIVAGGGGLGGVLFPWLVDLVLQSQLLPEGVGAWLLANREKLEWIARTAPLFLVAMGLLAVANVFLSHLVAVRAFRETGWLAGICLVYGVGLLVLPLTVNSQILWIGIGNAGLLLGAYVYSRNASR